MTRKSRNTGGTARGTTQVSTAPQTDAAPTAIGAASTPTGMSVPVGTNTSESGGDAAGRESTRPEIPQGNGSVTDGVKEPIPEVPAWASGASEVLPDFWLPSKALDALHDAFRDRAYPLTEDQLLRIAAIVREPVAAGDASPGDVPSTFEAFEARYPLSTALYAGWPAPDQEFGISITSKRDGFRRGDLVHGKAPEIYGAGDIAPEQLEAILSEPMLTVELV